MNRRFFLKASALTAAPLVLNKLPIYAGNSLPNPLLKTLATTANLCNRVLVIIQMNGGNDGLNMVIPLDKYTQLGVARPNLLIPSASVLSLTGTTTTGLHPSMTEIKSMYNSGKVAIVQGVSYPNPNYSHFQAQDIWFTGTNALPSPATGWLGNALDADFPGYPTVVTSPDPLAVQIGGSLPLSLQGPAINMGYNVTSPSQLLNVINATPAPAPVSDYGTELTFLRMMKDQSNAYTQRITTAYASQATLSTQYAASGNSLSDQLKMVARLIGGGLATPIYIVNHSDSFDLHVNQVDSANPALGAHASALSKLSIAVSAFMNDVQLMGKAHKVLGMTFSEFGRRVIQNTSVGTDHGSSAPVMLFGNNVNPGIVGTSPNLPATPTASTQVPMQYDFRQIYATIMQQWMCLSPGTTSNLLGGTFATLPLFNQVALPAQSITLSGAWQGSNAALSIEVEGAKGFRMATVERSFDGKSFQYFDRLDLDGSTDRQTITLTDWDVRSTAGVSEVLYRVHGVIENGDPLFSNTALLATGSKAGQGARIFPNPVVGGRVNVEFLKPVNGEVTISIYDSRGARLYGDQRHAAGSQMRIQLPVEDYDRNTLYFIKLSWDGREEVEKLTFE